jgi:hypothetical protein
LITCLILIGVLNKNENYEKFNIKHSQSAFIRDGKTQKESFVNLRDPPILVPDGVTDNSPILLSLLQNLQNNVQFWKGGSISLDSGVYLFNSEVRFSYPQRGFSLSFLGKGQKVSTLYFPNSNGITLYLSRPDQSFHFNGLSFACGCDRGNNNWCQTQDSCDIEQRGKYIGLSLSNPGWAEGNFDQNDIQNCTFQGIEGGQSCNYWNTAIWIIGICNINYYNLLIYGPGWDVQPNTYFGNGIIINGPDNSKNNPSTYVYSIVHNFQMCSIYNLANGLIINDFVQGVTLNQCNIANGGIAIYSPANTIGVLSELAITNSYFYCFLDQIRILNTVDQIMITNNNFFVVENNSGINLTNCVLFNIASNQFTCTSGNNNSGTTGINLQNCSKGVINGNVFYCLQNPINFNNSDMTTILQNTNLSV